MKIINLNPDAAIGASAWLVETDGHRILLDAGIHPKWEGAASLPLYSLVKHLEVDAVAVSHCHHDHVGSLPVAMRHFPKAHVLMTELSYFLAERVLHNSVNVMTRQRDEAGIKEYPLYTHRELEDIEPRFQGFKYNREIEWAAHHKTRAGIPSPTVEFFDAGHALGSAGILVSGKRKRLFYTGDVCFHDQTLLRKACFDGVKADVLLMETTRGNRAVPAGFTREKEADRLAEAVRSVLARKGSVLLPTFALGRTQEVLAQLALLMEAGKLPRQPVYIGGLSRVFTEIYDLQAHRTRRRHPALCLTEAHNLIVPDKKQVEKIRTGGGKLFVMTAGMMTEHTAAHELASRMIEDERQAVFFVGYSDPDSPAGRLRAAKDGERFFFSPSAGHLTRRCQVLDFDLTAHANRDELLAFAGEMSPRVILLGHGEPSSMQWFEEQLRTRHPKIKVLRPEPGQWVGT